MSDKRIIVFGQVQSGRSYLEPLCGRTGRDEDSIKRMTHKLPPLVGDMDYLRKNFLAAKKRQLANLAKGDFTRRMRQTHLDRRLHRSSELLPTYVEPPPPRKKEKPKSKPRPKIPLPTPSSPPTPRTTRVPSRDVRKDDMHDEDSSDFEYLTDSDDDWL